ncbi:hypothetical protein HDV63DRAFT_154556 [Trichoderma sp. SZMC 28014]
MDRRVWDMLCSTPSQLKNWPLLHQKTRGFCFHLSQEAALASGDHLPLEPERAETWTRHTTHRAKLIDRSWAAAARLLPVGWAALWPQLFAAMAILAEAENTMSPLGEKILKKEAKKRSQMIWTGLSRLCLVFLNPYLLAGTTPMVLTFQFGQGTSSALSPAQAELLNLYEQKLSGILRTSMLADCNQPLKLFGSMPSTGRCTPNASTESQISCAYACMHVRRLQLNATPCDLLAMHVHSLQATVPMHAPR